MPVASTDTLTSGISCGPESRQVMMPAAWSTATGMGWRISHQIHRWVGGAASSGLSAGLGGTSVPLPIVVTMPTTRGLATIASISTVSAVTPAKPHDQRTRR
jgi:hypothetical protein